MKIIHFGQKNFMTREGGVEVVVDKLAHYQVKNGYKVLCINRKSHHISGNEYDKELLNEYDGIKVEYAPTIDKKGLAALTASFFAALRSAFSNYDIIHIHAEGPGFFSFIPQIFGKKVVCHIHGLDWQRSKWKHSFAEKFLKKSELSIVKNANAIIVLSEAAKKYFKDKFSADTIYIPNGVEKPIIKDADYIKRKFGLDKDNYILYLSRIVPEKRLDLLIKAYRNIETNKKLVIAGSSSDTDEYYKTICNLAKEDDRIIFTGFVEGQALEELYSNSYIYVLPSDIEGMPLSLLEAMSYGNCCLTSNIEECTNVVENNAETFEHSNVESLKRKLQELLENNEKVDAYKRNASSYICSKYNWDETNKKIIEVYKNLLND